MTEASDRLVDLYLAMADRVLSSTGMGCHLRARRITYKIDVERCGPANGTLERPERALRGTFGLTPAADKTKIVASGKRATTTVVQ